MGGTKIWVLKLGEIIKALLFVIVGIALILLLIFLFVPKDKSADKEQALYMPGSYTASVLLYNGSADVEVVVSEQEILSVTLKNMPQEQEVFYPLLKPTMSILADEILESQSLEVKVPAENVMTGQVLLDALNQALEAAAAE